jgi:hypothetical protein
MMNIAAPKGRPCGDLNGVFMKRLVQNNSNAQLGLHPRRFSSKKNVKTPEQAIRHHRSMPRGGMRRQALSPPSFYLIFFIS